MKLLFLIGFHLSEMMSDPIIPASCLWESGSVHCVWRQPAIPCCGGQRLYQAIRRAVTIRKLFSLQWMAVKKEFLATPFPGFLLFPRESLPKWRALTRYIISLFLQLGHYFACSTARILACSFGLCQSAHWSTEAKQWSQRSKNADCTTVREKCYSYSTHGKACYNIINPPQQQEWGKEGKPALSAFLAQPILGAVHHAFLHRPPSLLHSSGRLWDLGLQGYELAKAFFTMTQRPQKPRSFLLSIHMFVLWVNLTWEIWRPPWCQY